MSVKLGRQIESMLQDKVDTGQYADADAVMREALRLLNERDAKLQQLRAALAKGEQGAAVPLTPELLEELNQSAMRRAKAGEQPRPDVCP
jgi:antitoxin ParD1/3/4